MKPEWCPQWAWDKAQAEAAQYVEWLEPKPEEYAQSEHVLAVSFARALLEAEQRGRRKGMDEAANIASGLAGEFCKVNGSISADYQMGNASGADEVANAIRAKMEEQP